MARTLEQDEKLEQRLAATGAIEAKNGAGPREWRVSALHLQLLDVPVTKIAVMVGKHYKTVKQFFASEDAIMLRRQLFGKSSTAEIKEELRSLWPLALTAVKALLESKDPNLIVQRANKGMELLMALGAKEADKQEITHRHIIDAAREAIIDAAKHAQKEEDKKAITVGNA